MDRVFGQKAMVEKATAEGIAEGIEIGKAKGIKIGAAEERERWIRKLGRDLKPDA